MGLAEYFCRPLLVWIFPNMAISWAKPYVEAPGAGLAGKPMGAQAQLLGTMCGAHETF